MTTLARLPWHSTCNAMQGIAKAIQHQRERYIYTYMGNIGDNINGISVSMYSTAELEGW